MKRELALVLLAGTVILGLAACAEVDDNGGIGIHPNGWITPGSDNSHRVVLESAGLPGSVETCAECHGADYGYPGTECFACHGTGGEYGHPESGFVGPAGATFHGQSVIDAGGPTPCAGCHAWEDASGLDFELGGWSQQSCDTCHAGGVSGHPATAVWLVRDSGDFHGDAAAGGMIADCAACHGAESLGGWTGVSCNACHPGLAAIHPAGWIGSSQTEGSHGWLVETGAIAREDCLGCHGEDYMGGWTGQGCLGCHPSFGGGATSPAGS